MISCQTLARPYQRVLFFSHLAQLAEHPAVNRKVAGSRPAVGANTRIQTSP